MAMAAAAIGRSNKGPKPGGGGKKKKRRRSAYQVDDADYDGDSQLDCAG